MAHSLVLPDNSEFRAVTSGLGLSNRDAIDEAIAYNRQLKATKRENAHAALRQDAEVGAALLARTAKGKTTRLREVEQYYGINDNDQ